VLLNLAKMTDFMRTGNSALVDQWFQSLIIRELLPLVHAGY